MRQPTITLNCDCGQTGYARYGERWTCPECGRTWDTSQIPSEEYGRLLKSVRRYQVLALGPPLLFAAILIPLAIVAGFQYGLLFFVLVFGYSVFVIPKLRERATQSVRESTTSWDLSPE